jgi:hypothetical protein
LLLAIQFVMPPALTAMVQLQRMNVVLGIRTIGLSGTCRAFAFHRRANRYLATLASLFNRWFDLGTAQTPLPAAVVACLPYT